MWLILSVISVLVLGFSVYMGFLNQGHIKAEKSDLDSNKSRLAKTNQFIDEENRLIEQANEARTLAEADRKKLEEDTASLKAKNEEATSKLAESKSKLEEQKAALAKLAEKMKGLPDLDALAENIRAAEAEVATLTQEIADNEAKVASNEAKAVTLDAAIKAAEEVEENVRRRVSAAGLKGKLITVHPSMGFVIIDTGVLGGVTPGSKLAVMRGTDKVAELAISSVEKNRSAADLVPGTLAAGQILQPGDTVVAIRPAIVEPPKEAPKTTAPAKSEDKQKDEATSDGSDIFGDDAAAGSSEEAAPATEAAPSEEADPFAE